MHSNLFLCEEVGVNEPELVHVDHVTFLQQILENMVRNVEDLKMENTSSLTCFVLHLLVDMGLLSSPFQAFHNIYFLPVSAVQSPSLALVGLLHKQKGHCQP